MSDKFIIAIDGPAGSGKSTTAKLVADKLGFIYIDTGAMYRAVTYLSLQHNAIDNPEKVVELLKESEISLSYDNYTTKIFLNSEEVSEKIRSLDVNSKVSQISRIPQVRELLVKRQQKIGSEGNVVMEGRDIATVVFPNADLKIFLTAKIEERANRRRKEFISKGKDVSLEEIQENLIERDELDSTRDVSPLQKADDAIELDTSELSIEQQVNEILKLAEEKMKLKYNK